MGPTYMCYPLGKLAFIVLSSDSDEISADDLEEQIQHWVRLTSMPNLWKLDKVTVLDDP